MVARKGHERSNTNADALQMPNLLFLRNPYQKEFQFRLDPEFWWL